MYDDEETCSEHFLEALDSGAGFRFWMSVVALRREVEAP
jgi:hypothetical protein